MPIIWKTKAMQILVRRGGFLGHVVFKERFKVDIQKVKAIID